MSDIGGVLTCDTYDNRIRWKKGERLDRVFEQKCDELTEKHGKSFPAVLLESGPISYEELDARANRLARYLRKRGLKSGARVGIMLKQSAETYISMLAVMKLNAAYVPLDVSFPRDRIAIITEDAGVRFIISLAENSGSFEGIGLETVYVDEEAATIARCSPRRLSTAEKGPPREQLCYVIYTSGSTGKPKGVAVDHPSICNFVKVAAEVYGYCEGDRVYQGMTIAFDFSVEEIWVPLLAGATLVPGISKTALAGCDLADFLEKNRITAMCCVPTLLATINRDLPDLKLLLLSGEACPQDLVSRWYRPGRKLLNVYGPTEATVTATWTEVRPEKPVTIGVPLPTYQILILEENEEKLVPPGGTGEICIAGIGLARGYLNREDLTTKAFIPDFLKLENNPSKRLYRTGDLGRITDDGEIEYFGRIDTQVKIRGYRIELTEIESALMEVPEIAQAVVNPWSEDGGPLELVAYCTLQPGHARLDNERVSAQLKARLPRYMIPAYIEILPEIPLLPSHKADRKKLPPPCGPRFTATSAGDHVAAEGATETLISDALAGLLGVDKVSVEDHFFDTLGAHSLLMARLSSDIRTHLPGATVSMRDLYQNPTVRQIAALIDGQSSARVQAPAENFVHANVPSATNYYLCGAFQLIFFLGFIWANLEIVVWSFDFMLQSTDIVDMYLRAVALNVMLFFGYSALPVVAKWVVVGTWKEDTFPIWGAKYFRFWVVKTLMSFNPILLFRSTPLFNLYLRLLGARIGKNVVILSQSFPLCTDLIDIGDDTVLRNYSILTGYRAQAGYIDTGPVTIGKGAVVGEHSMVDIGASLGDGGRLAHASLLPAGASIPEGATFQGSPARQCQSRPAEAEPRKMTAVRKTLYVGFHLGSTLFWVFPVLPLTIYFFFPELFGQSLATVASRLPQFSPVIFGIILAATAGLMVALLIVALVRVWAIPRLLNLLLREGVTYPLYGLRYFAFRMMTAASNLDYFNTLFGDSSYIVHYLRLIGVDLSTVIQTGSNFGSFQRFDSPFLCKVGSGTMVSSTLLMVNAQFSSTSFRLERSAIAENNFLGNVILVPPGSRAGDNCLLATKLMLPVDGGVRENTGLLGSPVFEIPRSVGTDKNFSEEFTPQERAALLRKKNRNNIASMALFLMSHWIFGLAAMASLYWTLKLFPIYGIAALAGATLCLLVFSIFFFALMEWSSLGFRKLRPNRCTILHKDYWQIEHHWKMSENFLTFLFRGTPFKNLISRLLGTKTGRMVYDDGCVMTERTLVEVGDYCTLSEFSIVQAHSMEDGIFKSDMIRLGAGTTIGTNSLVHYGVATGEQAIVDSDCFVMKGETLGEKTIWRGNPAMQVYPS
ncbi:peptide synthetase [Terrihabitans soli]|uniref:Peptide synthetase n=1 Tax=Terrihabitans soli TaxID=708113 RepID=A0A6S6QLM0_9HYPH|nr:Pls/PosA family non-ribosomal peptide synthetase [Terrihabitans soli]BCJ91304.1 peptide synthetase [Terrihabitans soli]